MSQSGFYSMVAIWVFSIGIYGFIVYRHLFKKILAVNIMGSGVFMFFIAIARRSAQIDPVPQAMVLTGIVISVSATAYALALLVRIRTDSPDEEESE